MSELRTCVGRLQTAVSTQQPTTRFSQRQRENDAAQMAAAIMARYGQGTALGQPLSPVLREMRVGQTAVSHHHHHQFHNQIQFRPRLQLVLMKHNHQQQKVGEIGSRATTSAVNWQERQPIPGKQQLTKLISRLQQRETSQQTAVQFLARRLNEQHQLIDTLSHQSRTLTSHTGQEELAAETKRPFSSPAPHSAQAVPRVLRQSRPPVAENSQKSSHRQPAVTEKVPFGVSRMEMGAGERAITAVDTNQLADQVMQKLENRLQAHRERTGRI